MPYPLPANEIARLEALRRYAVLDTPPERCFDNVTALAGELLDYPISLITLVDSERQWFKSHRGIEFSQTPRDFSFCAHAILLNEVMVVLDATLDTRFSQNPLVTGSPGIRSYVGAPLTSPEGFNLGTVCVIDTRARTGNCDREILLLRRLAAIVMDAFEMRRAAHTFDSAVAAVAPLAPLPVGIAVIDEEGLVAAANDASCRLFGYQHAEIVGRPFTDFLTPGQRRLARAVFEGFLAGEREIPPEWRMVRKDGQVIDVQVSGDRLIREDGKRFVVAALSDLTTVKIAENRILQVRKLDSVRRMAGGIAHNFNNLLTIILGYSEMLIDTARPASPVQRHAEEIRGAAWRAAEITGQLLAFSRHRAIAPEPLDLNLVIANLCPSLRDNLNPGVTLELDLRPEPRPILAVASQLEQAVRVLVSNAQDAMPSGGKVIIDTDVFEADDEFCFAHPDMNPGSYVVLRVRDTGRGMDAETQQHLFEPFFTTKPSGKGTGLSTVYGTVKQCGGELACDSEVGRGTTFTIYLPRAEQPSKPAKPIDAASPANATVTILLVEDRPDVRRTVRDMLGRDRYRVLEASGSSEALEIWKLHSEQIVLLITDVVMPKMHGPELAQVLRGENSALKVLFLSGYGDELAGGSFARMPGSGFLQKPFTLEALHAKIGELLGRPTRK